MAIAEPEFLLPPKSMHLGRRSRRVLDNVRRSDTEAQPLELPHAWAPCLRCIWADPYHYRLEGNRAPRASDSANLGHKTPQSSNRRHLTLPPAAAGIRLAAEAIRRVSWRWKAHVRENRG